MFGITALSLISPASRRAWIVAGLVVVALSCWATVRWESRVAAASTKPYLPCPGAGEPCRILPLGDSLTSGINYEGAYRVALFRLARAAGENITFTGSLQNGPGIAGGIAFPRHHEGRSGWRVEQIMATVPQPALNTLPHVILLHVGTNDIIANEQPERIAHRLEALITRLQRAAPQALIAVAQIIPFTDPALNGRAASYNSELKRRVESRQTRGEHLLVVDHFTHFPIAQLSDGVHPTQLGYEQMANTWYAGIRRHLRSGAAP